MQRMGSTETSKLEELFDNKKKKNPLVPIELARRISTSDLAESAMSFYTNYTDTGLFGVHCSAPPDRLHDLSSVIMEEFRRLASDVKEIDVEKARNQLKSAFLLHIDGSTSVSENNGRQMLTYGRIMPFLELFARIDAVDANTVMETAKHFIHDKNIAIAAVGPVKKLPEHSWFRSQTITRIFCQPQDKSIWLDRSSIEVKML